MNEQTRQTVNGIKHEKMRTSNPKINYCTNYCQLHLTLEIWYTGLEQTVHY